MIGVDNEAMIMAPMTVAVESASTPADAMTADSVSMVQNADRFARRSPSCSSQGGGGRIIGRDGQPVDQESFDRTVEIFLLATFRALRLAAASMATNEPLDSGQRGVIIQTASIAGYEGQVGQAAYGAAKAGVIGLTLPAARDLAPVGVRVMTIVPGTFFTPAFRMSEEDAYSRFGQAIQNPKRMGRADEYGQLALQIMENDYLNGESIRIDGALRFPAKPN